VEFGVRNSGRPMNYLEPYLSFHLWSCK